RGTRPELWLESDGRYPLLPTGFLGVVRSDRSDAAGARLSSFRWCLLRHGGIRIPRRRISQPERHLLLRRLLRRLGAEFPLYGRTSHRPTRLARATPGRKREQFRTRRFRRAVPAHRRRRRLSNRITVVETFVAREP